MEFVILDEKEYKDFEQNHEFGSFYQTIEWGVLKEKNGWNHFLVGIKENNKIIASALLLKKKVFANLSIIYSPRGFLIDYNNYELLNFFTKNIKKFAKSHHAIFVKIDPYIIYKERDINGNIVEGGVDNTNIINNLKKLNYKHMGFIDNNLQPRYAFALDFNNKSFDELYNKMETTTKQMIRKNEKIGIKTRKIELDELNKFTDVMKDTSMRRNFIDRPYEYYKNMLDVLKDNISILIAELDLNDYINRLNNELNESIELVKEYENRIKNANEKTNMKKLNNQLKETNIMVLSLNKKIKRGNELKDKKGEVLILGGLMFIFHNKEILSLYGGAYGEYREFMPAYTLNADMIKYGCLNGYNRYNFYGISEFKDKNNEMYGLYDFKRGFGGVVEEYIGEFNLVISKFWYFVYNVVYSKIYLKMKKSSK